MAALTAEDIAHSVANGNEQMFELLLIGVELGLPEHTEAAAILNEAGWTPDEDDAEEDPLEGVDRGQLEAFLLAGRSDPGATELALEELAEEDSPLAYRILELCAADDEQDWAQRRLHRETAAAETMWAEELAGREFDPDKFDLAYASAESNGEPEGAMGYYATDRLEADPPEIGVEWARPYETLGAEDNRHKVNAHSDGLDQAFAEFFADERNRANGHPGALEPDPEIAGDPMVRANLGALADEWTAELADSSRVHRHAQELQRKRAATT